jgi:hypothetical protein
MFSSPEKRYITYDLGNFKSMADFYNDKASDYTNIYKAKKTNVSTSVNRCNSLDIVFVAEDSDNSYYNAYHGFHAGPTWKSNNNSGCPFDDGGSAFGTKKLGGQNAPISKYLMWFVR